MQDSKTSYITQSFMWENLGLSGTSLIIYAIIYSFSKDGKGAFHGKQEYLAKITGKSRATVNAKLRELVTSGLIDEYGNSEYRTKIYRVNLEKLGIKRQSGTACREKEASDELLFKEDIFERDEPVKFSMGEEFSEKSNYESASVKNSNAMCQENLHNNKNDNKEIRQQYTTSTKSACEMRELEQKVSTLMKFAKIEYKAKKAKYEKSEREGRNIDIRDMYFKDAEKAREKVQKYDYAERNLELIDDDYFNTFDYYGMDVAILLTPAQHKYLLSWVGEDVLRTYLIKLEKYLTANPEYQIHSYYALLKKWISSDMTL